MELRLSWFTTVRGGCQLAVALGLLTTGVRAHAADAAPAPQMATIQARVQEKDGSLYHLRGEAQIDYKGYTLRADEADYNDDTGQVDARGHVTLDGGRYDEHITADTATYNVDTETGTFYNVAGTSGFRIKGSHITLTSLSPFAFTGKVVDKIGEGRYIVHHGTVTSCELPHPKWRYAASRIVINFGDLAIFYNSAFQVEGLPVFYMPYGWHPAEKKPRQSGFLLPSFGTSNRKGTILGDGFYWAINRSMDATVGAELWSSRGWAQHGQFRARPTDDAYFQADYFGVVDRGDPKTHVDQSGQDIHVNGYDELPWGVRGVISANYLSSFAFRQAWSETFAQAINSEVNSSGFLSKNTDGYSFNLLAQRYENFESVKAGDSVVIEHLPALESSNAERAIAGSRFFWSYDASLGSLSRKEPGFTTAGAVGRFDLAPQLSYAWAFHGWSFRPGFELRDTSYTKQLVPGSSGTLGTVIEDAINRRALEGSFEFRPPALHRIYGKPVFGHKLKHTIEPRVLYQYVTGINNFSEILRFDGRDILSDTNDLEFGVINRLYAKKLKTEPSSKDCTQPAAPAAGASPAAETPASQSSEAPESFEPAPSQVSATGCETGTPREVVTWELGQKAYFNRDFGGALAPGARNVLEATADFTGIAFLTDPRRLSPEISRLTVSPTLNSSASWDLDYDSRKGKITSSSVFMNYRTGDFSFGAGHTYLVTAGELAATAPVPIPTVFNQYRLSAGYGNGTKTGISTAVSVGFDVRKDFMQYIAVQSSYNWDCCGITTEFRRLALGPIRNENQFRFSFTLANVGNFGNLKKTERLY